jgi:hypothetical protein
LISHAIGGLPSGQGSRDDPVSSQHRRHPASESTHNRCKADVDKGLRLLVKQLPNNQGLACCCFPTSRETLLKRVRSHVIDRR